MQLRWFRGSLNNKVLRAVGRAQGTLVTHQGLEKAGGCLPWAGGQGGGRVMQPRAGRHPG